MPDQINESIAQSRLQYLFERYMDRSITTSEERELAELSLVPANDKAVQELEQDAWNKEGESMLTVDETESYMTRFFKARAAKVRPMLWRRIAVAASILLVVSLGAYFLFFAAPRKQGEVVQTKEPASGIKAPQTNRATITLADGTTVYLDSADNGQLAVQDNVKLVKLANGQIAYETTTDELLTRMQYNTLSNPRGSRVIDMALADGSHVWLNAGSSVTYPIAFAGNERRLIITGEAYFEVAHDKTKPFKVSKGGLTVEVLGTHFNVNAYDEEETLKVTLLEGAVKVQSAAAAAQPVVLAPGQQARVNAAGSSVTLINNVDTDQVMAWKNGFFGFTNADLPAMMRQIGRWYDVDVVFEGKVPVMSFGGDISRAGSLADVLRILEKSKVRCRMEGRKIIVLP
ncbi:MAG: FecR domain-containing protein [Chitinophagaceae bacterium]